jgi:hypothetical protein
MNNYALPAAAENDIRNIDTEHRPPPRCNASIALQNEVPRAD